MASSIGGIIKEKHHDNSGVSDIRSDTHNDARNDFHQNDTSDGSKISGKSSNYPGSKKFGGLFEAKSVFTIPNFITSLRIIAAPFAMYTILTGRYAAAFFILLIAAMTDSFDGKVARLLNKQTAFGAILDPIADVTLTTCTVIALLIQFSFPLWFGIIVLSREVIIILGGIACLFVGKFQLAKADIIGKLSRFFQMATVIVYVLAYALSYQALWIYILMYVTAILTLISTVIYLARAYALFMT
jgi:cardiolipin synthase (CMP-forming)